MAQVDNVPTAKQDTNTGSQDKYNQLPQLVDRLLVQSPPPSTNAFERFTTSGLFFMLFGSVLLLLAELSMGHTHSSLSFILVVTGVAILLYGTGTQGIGQFGNNSYKIAIAGGAGVLSLVIGYGIVVKQDSIKEAFQTQTKYIKLVIVPTTGDGISGSFFDNYVPVVSLDGGFEVPSVRQRRTIEAYVNLEQVRNGAALEISLYQDPKLDEMRKKLGKPFETVNISIGKVADGDIRRGSWSDLPVYTISAPINLKASGADRSQALSADNHQTGGQTRLTNPPPIDLLVGESLR